MLKNVQFRNKSIPLHHYNVKPLKFQKYATFFDEKQRKFHRLLTSSMFHADCRFSMLCCFNTWLLTYYNCAPVGRNLAHDIMGHARDGEKIINQVVIIFTTFMFMTSARYFSWVVATIIKPFLCKQNDRFYVCYVYSYNLWSIDNGIALTEQVSSLFISKEGCYFF